MTKESWKKIFGSMPNWKLPGLDLVQGFWLILVVCMGW